jgi:hypothetical protein
MGGCAGAPQAKNVEPPKQKLNAVVPDNAQSKEFVAESKTEAKPEAKALDAEPPPRPPEATEQPEHEPPAKPEAKAEATPDAKPKVDEAINPADLSRDAGDSPNGTGGAKPAPANVEREDKTHGTVEIQLPRSDSEISKDSPSGSRGGPSKRETKRGQMFVEDVVTPTPDGQPGSGNAFGKKDDGTLRANAMSPTMPGSEHSRASRVSFIDDSHAKVGSPSSERTAVEAWVKSTLNGILETVQDKEDPLQIHRWVRNVKKEIYSKVVVSSTRDFAKSVIVECISIASLTDWSKQCLRGILDKQQSNSRRRSSLSFAAPMLLDESVQKEFGTTRIVSITPGQADRSIELGQ